MDLIGSHSVRDHRHDRRDREAQPASWPADPSRGRSAAVAVTVAAGYL